MKLKQKSGPAIPGLALEACTKMKAKLAAMVCAFLLQPALAAETPKLDQEQTAVEKLFESEHIPDIVIRHIYQSAYWYTVNRVCGPDYATAATADLLSDENYNVAAKPLGVPLLIYKSRVALMAAKLERVLVANAVEATTFCRHHKELGKKPSTQPNQTVNLPPVQGLE